MTQRTLAAVIAVPVVVVLLVVSWVAPVPFTIYSPGPTVDVEGEFDGEPVVQVEGHQTYPTDGELRLTTVTETTREAKLTLWSVMSAWLDSDSAVIPLEVAHPDQGLTVDEERQQGQVMMASSQDGAIAAALTELDYDVTRAGVASVEAKGPSAGVLKVGDLLLEVDGTRVRTPEQVVAAVQQAEPGTPLPLRIKRGKKEQEVTVTPGDKDGQGYLGIGVGVDYDFPFEVSLHIDPTIGGPSAGLIMALSVYDNLTEGALLQGTSVAGTGTITAEGAVGPIGGIQQKIAASEDAGAGLFLVPADNCADVADLDTGDMRLAKVTTFEGAVDVLETWTDDSEAELPSCQGAA